MSNAKELTEKIKAVLLGLAVGDSLGVPVEFCNREELKCNPITDMKGFGTHSQPAGSFSDDTSLSLCLADALTHEFDLNLIARYFVEWYTEGYWTARGEAFDVGNATRHAIYRLKDGINPLLAGGREAKDNGNGSLMRISPLLFYIKDKTIEKRFELTRQVSSITHGHIRSVLSCFYYLEFMRLLLMGKDKFEAYCKLQTVLPSFLYSLKVDSTEINLFDRLFKGNIYELPENEIESSGYVLHTLEASIWCLLTTDNYKDAVLKAVNLGDDTDTTSSLTGGCAGLLYGIESIPQEWLDKLARRNDIVDLAERLAVIIKKV
ncbi:MAG: ADP-ribosylglycohydrolase family protein [Bacteroidales bacterium]